MGEAFRAVAKRNEEVRKAERIAARRSEVRAIIYARARPW